MILGFNKSLWSTHATDISSGRFLQKFAQISLLKKYGQKSNAFLTDLDTDINAYFPTVQYFTQVLHRLKKSSKMFLRFLADFREKLSSGHADCCNHVMGATQNFGIFWQNKRQKPQIYATQFAPRLQHP